MLFAVVGQVPVAIQPAGPIAIYALVDPRDRTVRYVGQTNDPARRLQAHFVELQNRERTDWLRELTSLGLCPEMLILDRCGENEADALEVTWIQRWASCGYLYNKRDNFPPPLEVNGSETEDRVRRSWTGIPTDRDLPHPGEILLREFLEPLKLAQTVLADRLGISVQRVNELVKGKRGVTPETAWLLSRAFDTTPEFWMNLQTQHDLTKNRVAPADLKFKAFV